MSVGIVLWICLTLLGFSVLIQQWPWIQQLIMLCGGIFLARMGYAMSREGWLIFRQSKLDQQKLYFCKKYLWLCKTTKTQTQYFLLRLYTNLTNPKTFIYFSSVFSLALSSSANPNLELQLAVIIPIQTFASFS